ncbi:hypothetical protein KAU34_09815 [candidate division WOR-3 bacterium]|nr:hypothetical protein [candidate division WOR-3 bacterium]
MIKKRMKTFWVAYRKFILIWLIIALFTIISITLGFDKKIIALVVLLVGFLTQAFGGLVGMIGAIPTIGPMIVKIVTLPFFLLLNAFAYLFTFFALRMGLKRDIVRARIIVTAFLVGIVIGFILGRIF